MDYEALQTFASQIFNEAHKLSLLNKVYWYSPQSRKLRPETKIGYYDPQPSNVSFEHGCKCIIIFPRLAFNDLKDVINQHLPLSHQIAYREDYKCSDDIGFDVYQRVQELKLFVETNNWSSKSYMVDSMLKMGEYWYDLQVKALEEIDPPLTAQEKAQIMSEVSDGFKDVLAYLRSQGNSSAKVQIRRNSGFGHSMIRVHPNDSTARLGFSTLALVFSHDRNLPKVRLPKTPNPNRKPRSDSIAAKYKADPSKFKYYNKFGIFEVYDK